MDERLAARIAIEVAAALERGDARAASERFDERMRAGLPPQQLSEVWSSFLTEHGALTSRGRVDAVRQGRYYTATVRLAFERASANLRLTVTESATVAGLYLVPVETPADAISSAQRGRRRMLAMLPVMAMVVAAYVLLASVLDLRFSLGGLLVGIGGWALAYTLRAPVALLARRRRLPEEQTATLVVGSSGPLEEGVRLGALAVIGVAVHDAYWLGVGWAAIEIVYASLTAIVALTIAQRGDDQGEQFRAQLAAQPSLTGSAPLWGVLERVSATAFHVGAALLLARASLMAIPVAVVHSALNLVAVRLASRSIPLTEAVVAGVGGVVLGAGLLAAGVI